MSRLELYLGLLRLPLDFAAGLAALLLARSLRLAPQFWPSLQDPAQSVAPLPEYLPFALAAAVGLTVVLAAGGLYRFRLPAGAEARQVVFLVATWTLLLAATFFFGKTEFFSRLVLAYAAILTVLFVWLARFLVRQLRRGLARAGYGRRVFLVIGRSPAAYELAGTLACDPINRIAGHAETAHAHAALAKYRPTDLLLADPLATAEERQQLFELARTQHLGFHLTPDLLAVPPQNVDVATVGGLPLISLRPTPLTGWGRVVKRIFDLLVATFALIFTAPIWLATAVAIRLESPGPIFFTRRDDGTPVTRVGLHGRPIPFWKFRSMRAGTDSLRYSLKNSRAGPLVKITDDPRITRVGRFIRRYSIDELPQLLLVLTGRLSLVGPRAHLPEEVARYTPAQRRVLAIKPGVTGLSQVSGRSDLPFEREIELDTWYIENWSLWLDLKILWRTVGVVLFPQHRE